MSNQIENDISEQVESIKQHTGNPEVLMEDLVYLYTQVSMGRVEEETRLVSAINHIMACYPFDQRLQYVCLGILLRTCTRTAQKTAISCIQRVIATMKNNIDHAGIQMFGCLWMSSMATRSTDEEGGDEIWEMIAPCGGIEAVVNALEMYGYCNEQVQAAASKFLLCTVSRSTDDRAVNDFGGGLGSVFTICQWIEENRPEHQQTLPTT
jgi:hypothetical protein